MNISTKEAQISYVILAVRIYSRSAYTQRVLTMQYSHKYYIPFSNGKWHRSEGIAKKKKKLIENTFMHMRTLYSRVVFVRPHHSIQNQFLHTLRRIEYRVYHTIRECYMILVTARKVRILSYEKHTYQLHTRKTHGRFIQL